MSMKKFLKKHVDKLAYVLLAVGFVGWNVGIIIVSVSERIVGPTWAWTIVFGAVFLVGALILFVKVLVEQLRNKEDRHYSKDVHD